MFENRKHAGQLLAERLKKKDIKDPVVLALPRGGVPVALEIAKVLDAPVDILAVRKIGAPSNPEFAIGAIGEDGDPLLNSQVITRLNFKKEDVQEIIEAEKREVQRQIKTFRHGQAGVDFKGRNVVVVDDGLATGATAMVAVRYLKNRGAGDVILAVPVAAHDAAERLRERADDLVTVEEPDDLLAINYYYYDFSPLSDQDVIQLLDSMRSVTISVPFSAIELTGRLSLPTKAKALILFAHGSGSSRSSPRNQFVAEYLNDHGFATLLFDLLTDQEALDRACVFNIPLLAERLMMAREWVAKQSQISHLPIGYFGASTGAAAALTAAANAKSGDQLYAVVSRGGRPDLAHDKLKYVNVPVLLVVGELDDEVINLNRQAQIDLPDSHLIIVPDAGHLFEEPGTLALVAKEACRWFLNWIPSNNLQANRSMELEHRFP